MCSICLPLWELLFTWELAWATNLDQSSPDLLICCFFFLSFFPQCNVASTSFAFGEKNGLIYSSWDSHRVAQARHGLLILLPHPLEWRAVKSQSLPARILPSYSPGTCNSVLYGQCHGCPFGEPQLENRRLLARNKMNSEEFKFFSREVGGHHPYS